jgi:hypothetical protein
MHKLPIPFIHLRYSFHIPAFFAKLKLALVPMEDQWTWTTLDGIFFEDVEVDGIQVDDVVFRHKFGKSQLPITDLSADARLKLYRSYERGDHF